MQETQEMWVPSLGQIPGLGGPLEEEMETHSGILAWKKPLEGPWRATVQRVAKSQTQLSTEHTQTLEMISCDSKEWNQSGWKRLMGLYHQTLDSNCTVLSLQFSHSVASDSANPRTEEPQASLSITNSRSLLKIMSTELVMTPNISSFVIPFSSCLQSFPASGSFPRSQFFPSGGQSIGVSASASVLPINIPDWFALQFTGLISNTYMTTGKTIALTRWTLVSKVMSLLF